jgi:hypothetical protein
VEAPDAWYGGGSTESTSSYEGDLCQDDNSNEGLSIQSSKRTMVGGLVEIFDVSSDLSSITTTIVVLIRRRIAVSLC